MSHDGEEMLCLLEVERSLRTHRRTRPSLLAKSSGRQEDEEEEEEEEEELEGGEGWPFCLQAFRLSLVVWTLRFPVTHEGI